MARVRTPWTAVAARTSYRVPSPPTPIPPHLAAPAALPAPAPHRCRSRRPSHMTPRVAPT
eukprot:5670147-Prymnesium_polylepis.1